MAPRLLGRTNASVPPVWLSLRAERADSLEAIISVAEESQTPIDVTTLPALCGRYLREARVLVAAELPADYASATGGIQAADLMSAGILQTLCSLGRPALDIAFLRISAEDERLDGAMEALESARAEGHIRWLGLRCDSRVALSSWHSHDAFEVVDVPRNHWADGLYREVLPLAKDRRVGVITSRPLAWRYGLPFMRLASADPETSSRLATLAIRDLCENHPVVVGVRSEQEAHNAIAARDEPLSPDLSEQLRPYLEAASEPAGWEAFADEGDSVARRAYRAWKADRREGVVR